MTKVLESLATRAADEGLLDVAYARLDTPLGEGLVAATRRGLVRLALPNERADDVLEALAADVSPRVLEWPAGLDDARRELDEYFAGHREEFDLHLDWRLSNPGFYRRVLRATARVPRCRLRSWLQPDPDRGPVSPGGSLRRRDRQLRGRPGDEALPAGARGSVVESPP
jgi:methylated-DNA-[protein]-cysteine S-methyltransferase